MGFVGEALDDIGARVRALIPSRRQVVVALLGTKERRIISFVGAIALGQLLASAGTIPYPTSPDDALLTVETYQMTEVQRGWAFWGSLGLIPSYIAVAFVLNRIQSQNEYEVTELGTDEERTFKMSPQTFAGFEWLGGERPARRETLNGEKYYVTDLDEENLTAKVTWGGTDVDGVDCLMDEQMLEKCFYETNVRAEMVDVLRFELSDIVSDCVSHLRDRNLRKVEKAEHPGGEIIQQTVDRKLAEYGFDEVLGENPLTHDAEASEELQVDVEQVREEVRREVKNEVTNGE
jgi:hypothetical protein